MAAGMRSGEEMSGCRRRTGSHQLTVASEIKGTGENAQGERERGVIRWQCDPSLLSLPFLCPTTDSTPCLLPRSFLSTRHGTQWGRDRKRDKERDKEGVNKEKNGRRVVGRVP